VGRFGHSIGFDEGHTKEPLDLVKEFWHKGALQERMKRREAASAGLLWERASRS
jgi:hypothetical protein